MRAEKVWRVSCRSTWRAMFVLTAAVLPLSSARCQVSSRLTFDDVTYCSRFVDKYGGFTPGQELCLAMPGDSDSKPVEGDYRLEIHCSYIVSQTDQNGLWVYRVRPTQEQARLLTWDELRGIYTLQDGKLELMNLRGVLNGDEPLPSMKNGHAMWCVVTPRNRADGEWGQYAGIRSRDEVPRRCVEPLARMGRSGDAVCFARQSTKRSKYLEVLTRGWVESAWTTGVTVRDASGARQLRYVSRQDSGSEPNAPKWYVVVMEERWDDRVPNWVYWIMAAVLGWSLITPFLPARRK